VLAWNLKHRMLEIGAQVPALEASEACFHVSACP
jgi:hypothetical protein